MLRLFNDVGLTATRRFDGPEVHCVIDLRVDETYLAASEARGRAADVASLEPLLKPRSIAVVGAGRRPGSVGRVLLHHLHEDGFTGRLFAVNPAARAILGIPSYPSVAAVPVTPDLVIVASPAETVPAVAQECGKAGVRALGSVSLMRGLTVSRTCLRRDLVRQSLGRGPRGSGVPVPRRPCFP